MIVLMFALTLNSFIFCNSETIVQPSFFRDRFFMSSTVSPFLPPFPSGSSTLSWARPGMAKQQSPPKSLTVAAPGHLGSYRARWKPACPLENGKEKRPAGDFSGK